MVKGETKETKLQNRRDITEDGLTLSFVIIVTTVHGKVFLNFT